MPSSPATLERQCVPLRTGAAAAEVAARQYNHGPLAQGERAALEEATHWADRSAVMYGPVGEVIGRLPAECSGIGFDEVQTHRPAGMGSIVLNVAGCLALFSMSLPARVWRELRAIFTPNHKDTL